MDLKKLIPEYLDAINKCRNEYTFMYLLKYAILCKYGGLWLPKDVLVLNKFIIPEKEYYSKSNSIIVFAENNLNHVNNFGYSDYIIASSKDNKVMKKLLLNVIKNLDNFNNDIVFSNFFNQYFNETCKNNIHYMPITMDKNISNKYITIDTYMGIFNNNIVNYKNKSFFILNLSKLDRHPKYCYLTRMSELQIFKSNLFLTTLIKFAFNQKKNIIHCANIKGN